MNPKKAEPTPVEKPEYPELKRQALKDAGNPENVHRVDVRPISNGRARVNIWVIVPNDDCFVQRVKLVYSEIYFI